MTSTYITPVKGKKTILNLNLPTSKTTLSPSSITMSNDPKVVPKSSIEEAKICSRILGSKSVDCVSVNFSNFTTVKTEMINNDTSAFNNLCMTCQKNPVIHAIIIYKDPSSCLQIPNFGANDLYRALEVDETLFDKISSLDMFVETSEFIPALIGELLRTKDHSNADINYLYRHNLLYSLNRKGSTMCENVVVKEMIEKFNGDKNSRSRRRLLNYDFAENWEELSKTTKDTEPDFNYRISLVVDAPEERKHWIQRLRRSIGSF